MRQVDAPAATPSFLSPVPPEFPMRLFIAIPLPEAALAEAAAVLRELQRHDWPVRWVRADSLHITLKFFGEVTSDRTDTIAEMLGFAAAGMRPMSMMLAGVGAFPENTRPRVIRLELEAGPELELLQDRLERGGERIGFAPEGRPFHPHITLGRVREGHRLPPNWATALSSQAGGTAFLVDRVVLYESQLGPDGPAYAVRQEILFS
jgi:2'-5' RNA ligase